MAALGGTAPYWEKDGALRAYANRSLILAGVLTVAVVVLGAIVLVTRAKPPVVIRVGPDGAASVISPEGARVNTARYPGLQTSQQSAEPSEMEKKNLVISFVNSYYGYDDHTISEHWAAALNMMSNQLKKDVYGKMSADGTVGKIEASKERSVVTISSVDADEKDPLTYHVLATRIDTSVSQGKSFSGTKTAESYTVNLAKTENRTIQNPSQLMVVGFKRDVSMTEVYVPDQQ